MLRDTHTLIGMLAGVTTSALFTGTALCFTAAGKRIGSTMVNALRIYLAVALLALTHRLMTGQWVPGMCTGQAGYLAASGIIGLTIGDLALITAFIDIGPRLSTLVMTTAPLFAALLGWAVLGERLHPLAWSGVLLTIGGVAWVVLERPRTLPRSPHFGRGVLLALTGAACQAAGLLLSKKGMGHGWLSDADHLAPQPAALTRMFFAALAAAPMLAVHRRIRRRAEMNGAVRASRTGADIRRGILYTAMGAVVGPFLGVWMSLVATDRAHIGIAQTLCSLTPIFILPVAAFVHREPISIRAAVGALLAVGGAAVLFLEPPG